MKEVLPIIVTSIITLIATLVGFWAQALIQLLLDKKGSLKIYRKIVYQKKTNGATWGVIKNTNGNGMYFSVPLWIEVQNTKNISEIIRNFNIILYKDNIFLRKMVQVSHYGESNDEFYGDSGKYSFIIPPKSIQRYDLQFILHHKDSQTDFDEIKVSYFDSSDNEQIFSLKKVPKSWTPYGGKIDNDWILLKK